MGFKAATVAIAGMLALAGCAGRGMIAWPEGQPIVAAVYQAVDQQFVEQPNFRSMSIDGLRRLTQMDHAFAIETPDRSLRLSRAGVPLIEKPMPADGDAFAWAALVEQALAAAAAAAPELPEREELLQEVMDGALADLDRFSRYASPRRASIERGMRDGYGGIGLSFEAAGDALLVQRVFAGGPAAQAGIAGGDRILAIDGLPVKGLTAEEARDRMVGPIDSSVILVLDRTAEVPRPVTLTRRFVVPQTVLASRIGDTLVIAIDRFNTDTARDLRQALDKALAEGGFRRLLIDLRGNPGGFVDQGVASADIFLSGGLIARADGRAFDSKQIWRADSDQLLAGMPIRLLIDSGTASAAEIMAAALTENGRATAVGTDSFGKGVIQNVLTLPNDGALYLTWANLYTPGGRGLHKLGIRPGLCLDSQGQARTVPAMPLPAGKPTEALIREYRASCPPAKLAGAGVLNAVAAAEW